MNKVPEDHFDSLQLCGERWRHTAESKTRAGIPNVSIKQVLHLYMSLQVLQVVSLAKITTPVHYAVMNTAVLDRSRLVCTYAQIGYI